MKNAAIVLAGGSGRRMHSNVKKQYLLIGDKPVLYYSLEAFQSSSLIDEIILVCSYEDIEQCREEIVVRYGFTKVKKIVAGGKERHDSVFEGLKALEDCTYVMIHDGARPFIDEEMLERIWSELPSVRACTVGMPVKDTIKKADPDGFAEERLWNIQTPQAFAYDLIRRAHELRAEGLLEAQITDDAMLIEYTEQIPVKLIEGSYENIKITTPEDLLYAELIWRQRREKTVKSR